jgi:hypothetical protein
MQNSGPPAYNDKLHAAIRQCMNQRMDIHLTEIYLLSLRAAPGCSSWQQ